MMNAADTMPPWVPVVFFAVVLLFVLWLEHRSSKKSGGVIDSSDWMSHILRKEGLGRKSSQPQVWHEVDLRD